MSVGKHAGSVRAPPVSLAKEGCTVVRWNGGLRVSAVPKTRLLSTQMWGSAPAPTNSCDDEWRVPCDALGPPELLQPRGDQPIEVDGTRCRPPPTAVCPPQHPETVTQACPGLSCTGAPSAWPVWPCFRWMDGLNSSPPLPPSLEYKKPLCATKVNPTKSKPNALYHATLISPSQAQSSSQFAPIPNYYQNK